MIKTYIKSEDLERMKENSREKGCSEEKIEKIIERMGVVTEKENNTKNRR